MVAAVEGGGGEEGRETVVERRWLGDEGESRAREGEREGEKRKRRTRRQDGCRLLVEGVRPGH